MNDQKYEMDQNDSDFHMTSREARFSSIFDPNVESDLMPPKSEEEIMKQFTNYMKALNIDPFETKNNQQFPQQMNFFSSEENNQQFPQQMDFFSSEENNQQFPQESFPSQDRAKYATIIGDQLCQVLFENSQNGSFYSQQLLESDIHLNFLINILIKLVQNVLR